MRGNIGQSTVAYMLVLVGFFVSLLAGWVYGNGAAVAQSLKHAQQEALREEEVAGYFDSCAAQRLAYWLRAAHINPSSVQILQETTDRQPAGQPVYLALRYVYRPPGSMFPPITMTADEPGVSQYLPGQAQGGGCP